MTEYYYMLRVCKPDGEVERLSFAYADGAENVVLAQVRKKARDLAGKGCELLTLERRVAESRDEEGELLEQLPLPSPDEGRGVVATEQSDEDLMGEGGDPNPAPARAVPQKAAPKPERKAVVPQKVGDPVAIINALDPEVIRQRIKDLDGERAALEVFLAAAEARQARKGRGEE